jgi:carboxymethylenebutenolidase
MRKVINRLAACGVLAALVTVGACSSGDAPPPAPAADGKPDVSAPAAAPTDEATVDDREIVAESLPYAEVRDALVYGYFAFPADMLDPLPAVVVVHDRWGLNDDIRQAADRLAASGYIVLAIDLFLGKTVDSPADARDLEIDVLENPRRVEDNISQAIEFVRVSSSPPGMAILGFGLGGGLALDTALDHPDALDAAVSFYGQLITDQDDLARLEVPFQGFFAPSDRAVPLTTVEDFQKTADALEKDVSIEILEDARHGFAAASSETYDAAVMDTAWGEMLAFLKTRFAAAY